MKYTHTIQRYGDIYKYQYMYFLYPAHPKKSEKPSCLFQSVEFFVRTMALQGVEGATRCFDGPSEPPVLSPREGEWYNRVKCEVILHLLQFVGVLVDHHYDNPASVRPVVIPSSLHDVFSIWLLDFVYCTFFLEVDTNLVRLLLCFCCCFFSGRG